MRCDGCGVTCNRRKRVDGQLLCSTCQSASAIPHYRPFRRGPVGGSGQVGPTGRRDDWTMSTRQEGDGS